VVGKLLGKILGNDKKLGRGIGIGMGIRVWIGVGLCGGVLKILGRILKWFRLIRLCPTIIRPPAGL
jgi:hypothetical protein